MPARSYNLGETVSCPMCGKRDPATAHRRRLTCCSRECSNIYRSDARRLAREANKRKREEVVARLVEKLGEGMTMRKASEVVGIHASRASALNKEFGFFSREEYSVNCGHCGKNFRASPSADRTFCSYQCFLDSGGAKRAGEAAVMARKKYGYKKDANHDEIFEAIRTVTAVHDLSSAGCGVPDGLAWSCGGWHLFDVKNLETAYGRRGLNPRQKKWASDWRGGPVYLIHDVDEALRFARGDFEGLKFFPTEEDILEMHLNAD